MLPWQKILVGRASLNYNQRMQHFRHNLSPVEVKIFLKTVAPLTDNLLIRYCHKIAAPCPECGHQALCRSAAISVFSSSIDKITHEITVCLKCGYKNLSTVLTCERL
jgi:hypothetical protein